MRTRLSMSACVAFVSACSGGEVVQALPELVAKVNGEPITVLEYRAALALEARENEGLSPQPPEAIAAARRRIIDGLVDKKLISQTARKRNLKIPDDEVERAFLRLRADWPGESFDKMLTHARLTTAELKDQLRDKLLVERLFVEEVFARIAVTDEEVTAWVSSNGSTLARPEQVRAAQIVVKTEEEARGLLSELKRGGDFAALARRYSLSPDARAGGDLGFFGRGEMPPLFEEICFTLGVNRLSDVVASPYGFHIFKVLERKEAEQPAQDTIRDLVENRLRREKETTAQEEFLLGLRNTAQVWIDEAALARLAEVH